MLKLYLIVGKKPTKLWRHCWLMVIIWNHRPVKWEKALSEVHVTRWNYSIVKFQQIISCSITLCTVHGWHWGLLIWFMYVYCAILAYISEKAEMLTKTRTYRAETSYGVTSGKWSDMLYCNIILCFYFHLEFPSMK